ncbi:MAG TPA: PEGA domain-containing protein, partial [Spirochaetota bacterium]|nr:PEGA domain-containing protein [Spirochaetota bacterium]
MVSRKKAILIMFLIFSIFYLWSGEKLIKITSEPVGASVYLNNELKGITPYEIKVADDFKIFKFKLIKSPYNIVEFEINPYPGQSGSDPTISKFVNLKEMTWLKSDRSSLGGKGDYIYNDLASPFTCPLTWTQKDNNNFNQTEKNYYMNANDSNAYSYNNDSDDFSVIKTVHLQQWWRYKHKTDTVGGPYRYDISFWAKIKEIYSVDDNPYVNDRITKYCEFIQGTWDPEKEESGWENVYFDIYNADSNQNPIICSSHVFEKSPPVYVSWEYRDEWNRCAGYNYKETYGGESKLILFKSKSPILTVNGFNNTVEPKDNNYDNFYPFYLTFPELTINTSYRVKTIKVFFFNQNGGFCKQALNSIDDYSDGINSLTIPKDFLDMGKYEMVVAVIDKFNKINYFKPMKFSIGKVELTNKRFGNMKGIYKSFSGDLNTTMPKIFLAFDVEISGIAENSNLSESDFTETGITGIFNKKIEFGTDKICLKYECEVSLNNNNLTTFTLNEINFTINIIKLSSVSKQDIKINCYPKRMNLVSLGSITSEEISLVSGASTNELNLLKDDFRAESDILERDESLKSKDFSSEDKKIFSVNIIPSNDVEYIKLSLIRKGDCIKYKIF